MCSHKTGGNHSKHYLNEKSTSVIAFQFLKGSLHFFPEITNILKL